MVGLHSYNQLSNDEGFVRNGNTIGTTTIGEKSLVVRLSSPDIENIDEFESLSGKYLEFK